MTRTDFDLLRGYNAAMRNETRDPFETSDYYEGYDLCQTHSRRKPHHISTEELADLGQRIGEVLATRAVSQNA